MSVWNFLGAGLGAVSNYADAKIQAKQSKWNTLKTIEANRDAAALQWEQNLNQWNRENEYNDPTQQMARLERAGINPHLAYMKGTLNNVSAQSPTAQQPQNLSYHNIKPMQYSSTIAGAMDAVKGVSQVRHMEEQIIRQGIENDLQSSILPSMKQSAKDDAYIKNLNASMKQIELNRDIYGVKDAPTAYKVIFEYLNAQLKGKNHTEIYDEFKTFFSGLKLDERLKSAISAFEFSNDTANSIIKTSLEKFFNITDPIKNYNRVKNLIK